MKYEENQIEKVLDLLDQISDYNVFVFDNLLIKGYKVDIAKKYVNENPSKQFRTWLIDNDLVIKEIN